MHEIHNLWGIVCEGYCWQTRNPLFVLLTFQIIYQGQDQHEGNWTWHDLWNLLITIKLSDKSFHNSIDLSGLYVQVYITLWLGRMLWFMVFRLSSDYRKMLENAFDNQPPWYDLIISSPMKNSPSINFSKNVCPPIYH